MKIRYVFAIALVGLCLSGCEYGAEPDYQVSLPVTLEPFDILVDDIDDNGFQDVTVIFHGENFGQTYFQQRPREFQAGEKILEVGFHPGNLIRWINGESLHVMAAEGQDEIRGLKSKIPGGFEIVSTLKVDAPRYINGFSWPGWGNSLAASVFDADQVVLLKNYDPLKGQAEKQIQVALSQQRPSVRVADRIAVADMDGDKIDELLFASKVEEEVLQLKYSKANPQDLPEITTLFRDPNWGMPNEVHPVDLDGDGDNDLLVPDETPPGNINVLLNNGQGNFQPGKSLGFVHDQGVVEMAIGRDKDGSNVILAVGYGAVALYRIPPGWRDGEAMPRLSINMSRNENNLDLVLKDIDGDGWLDGVIGRNSGENNVWIVYGPLWDNFNDMMNRKFILDNKSSGRG